MLRKGPKKEKGRPTTKTINDRTKSTVWGGLDDAAKRDSGDYGFGGRIYDRGSRPATDGGRIGGEREDYGSPVRDVDDASEGMVG